MKDGNWIGRGRLNVGVRPRVTGNPLKSLGGESGFLLNQKKRRGKSPSVSRRRSYRKGIDIDRTEIEEEIEQTTMVG